jgi:hypothetical protein
MRFIGEILHSTWGDLYLDEEKGNTRYRDIFLQHNNKDFLVAEIWHNHHKVKMELRSIAMANTGVPLLWN